MGESTPKATLKCTLGSILRCGSKNNKIAREHGRKHTSCNVFTRSGTSWKSVCRKQPWALWVGGTPPTRGAHVLRLEEQHLIEFIPSAVRSFMCEQERHTALRAATTTTRPSKNNDDDDSKHRHAIRAEKRRKKSHRCLTPSAWPPSRLCPPSLEDLLAIAESDLGAPTRREEQSCGRQRQSTRRARRAKICS